MENFKDWFWTGYNKWYLFAGVSLAVGLIGWIL